MALRTFGFGRKYVKLIGTRPVNTPNFFYFTQIYNLLYNGAISKYVVRKHLCGAIIQ
jgi:hypothetical protein